MEWEQVSLFLRPGLVLTFQKRHDDCLDPLRQRIREAGKVIRRSQSDYLACMVVDALVDGYFPLLERHGDELERLEAEILADPQWPEQAARARDALGAACGRPYSVTIDFRSLARSSTSRRPRRERSSMLNPCTQNEAVTVPYSIAARRESGATLPRSAR